MVDRGFAHSGLHLPFGNRQRHAAPCISTRWQGVTSQVEQPSRKQSRVGSSHLAFTASTRATVQDPRQTHSSQQHVMRVVVCKYKDSITCSCHQCHELCTKLLTYGEYAANACAAATHLLLHRRFAIVTEPAVSAVEHYYLRQKLKRHTLQHTALKKANATCTNP